MKIIDFEKKGNIVRFYLGEKTPDWGWTRSDYVDSCGKRPDWLEPQDQYYGDDWDDRPYEHNAGRVYDEFIKGHKDVVFNFEDMVLEPCEDYHYSGNSSYNKEDMRKRKVPCIIVVPADGGDLDLDDSFSHWVGNDHVKRFYFGDEMDPD